MKPKTPKNIAASHRAKLLNLAQERGEGFQFFLGRWISERFLFRLGRSAHRDQFILKGAMVFVAWDGKLHRPTQDVDLLGYGNPEVGEVVQRAFARSARNRWTTESSSTLRASVAKNFGRTLNTKGSECAYPQASMALA
jgi:hypothetical protein